MTASRFDDTLSQESRVRDWSNRTDTSTVDVEIDTKEKAGGKSMKPTKCRDGTKNRINNFELLGQLNCRGRRREIDMRFGYRNRCTLLLIGLTLVHRIASTVARPLNAPTFTQQIVEVDRCRERSDNAIFRNRKRKRNVGVFYNWHAMVVHHSYPRPTMHVSFKFIYSVAEQPTGCLHRVVGNMWSSEWMRGLYQSHDLCLCLHVQQ